MGAIGDFFEKVGKTVGAIAVSLVPGIELLAQTGIMGSDLQAFADGPQTTAVQQLLTSDPALLANTVAARNTATLQGMMEITPAGMAARFAGKPMPILATASPTLSGRTLNAPVEYVQALSQARNGTYVDVPSGALSGRTIAIPVEHMTSMVNEARRVTAIADIRARTAELSRII